MCAFDGAWLSVRWARAIGPGSTWKPVVWEKSPLGARGVREKKHACGVVCRSARAGLACGSARARAAAGALVKVEAEAKSSSGAQIAAQFARDFARRVLGGSVGRLRVRETVSERGAGSVRIVAGEGVAAAERNVPS